MSESPREKPIEFEKTEEGFNRIIIESYIKDSELVFDVQEELEKRHKTFVRQTPEKLHITIAHIGKPHELLKDLQQVKPDLDEPTFLSALSRLLVQCRNLVEKESQVTVLSVALFDEGLWCYEWNQQTNSLRLSRGSMHRFLRCLKN